MHGNFTEQAIDAILAAEEAARRFGQVHVGTRHFLMGILKVADRIAAKILAEVGLTDEKVLVSIQGISAVSGASISGPIPFSEEAEQMLLQANKESLKLGHGYIGPQHLLLAMIGDQNSVGARILVQNGVDLAKLKETVTQASITR
jgi:ATP-dependent Clp protease ATP-binding subunit ClpC